MLHMTWAIPALSAWQLMPQAQYDRKYYWLKPVIGPSLGGTWQDSNGFLLEIKEYQSFNLKGCKNTEFLTCVHAHTHSRDSSKITLSSGGRDRGRWLTQIHLQSSPALEAAKWRFTKRENKWCILTPIPLVTDPFATLGSSLWGDRAVQEWRRWRRVGGGGRKAGDAKRGVKERDDFGGSICLWK